MNLCVQKLNKNLAMFMYKKNFIIDIKIREGGFSKNIKLQRKPLVNKDFQG